MTGTVKVISAKLSASGWPLVQLVNYDAFLYNPGMKCWMRIVDNSFPASKFALSLDLSSAKGGELARLQAGVARYNIRRNLWNRYEFVLKNAPAYFTPYMVAGVLSS